MTDLVFKDGTLKADTCTKTRTNWHFLIPRDAFHVRGMNRVN